MNVIRLVALALSLFGAACPADAQESAPASGIAGRWNLALQTPQGSFRTPVEFIVHDRGRVTATVLGFPGTFRISDASGTLEGDRLRLSARSSFGSIRVRARLEGGRLTGQWSPGGLISGLFFRGELRGVRDGSYAPRPRLQLYDEIWAQLERHFYAPDFNGVDPRALKERYRASIAASRTDGEFLVAMRRMLAELRTSHLDLFATPSSQPEDLPAPPAQPEPRTEGVTWRQISPSIGYLRIESFDDGPAVIDRIDRAFAELGHNESLVIDVRENGGGSLSTAIRMGDFMFAEQRPVGYFASRQGLERHNARSIDDLDRTVLPIFTGYTSTDLGREMVAEGAVMLATGGRAPQPYLGRVAILIDEYCFSACEAFASVAKESRAATLFGRRTAGAMLASFPLAIDGGWTLLLPAWDFRTPLGAKVEGRGVEPDVQVRKGRGDPELAAALRFLREPAAPVQSNR